MRQRRRARDKIKVSSSFPRTAPRERRSVRVACVRIWVCVYVWVCGSVWFVRTRLRPCTCRPFLPFLPATWASEKKKKKKNRKIREDRQKTRAQRNESRGSFSLLFCSRTAKEKARSECRKQWIRGLVSRLYARSRDRALMLWGVLPRGWPI